MRELHSLPLLMSLLVVTSCLTNVHSTLWADEAADPKLARINPQGINGTLVLAGETLPAKAIDQFVEVAEKAGERLVLLQFGASETTSKSVQRLVTAWQSSKSARFEIVQVTPMPSRIELVTAVLSDATAVWLTGIDTTAMETSIDLRKAIAHVVQRAGVVGCCGQFATYLGNCRVADLDGESSEINAPATLSLLPDSFICAASLNDDAVKLVQRATKLQPHLVGYVIGSDATLIVQGRRLRVIGPGEIQVCLASSPKRDGPANARYPTTLSSRRMGDLTALRRAARDRDGALFPPLQPQPPMVENGTLIAIGGDGMPKGIVDRFVKLAGGNQASIVVLPTAMPDPIRKRNGMARSFREAGAGRVTVLPDRSLPHVESPEYLDAFRSATGIWFGGGRQWRFVDAYSDTKALALMHDVLKRGGVIMGSSAGASIQAEYLVRGNPLGNTDMMANGYERGLGFLSGVAIDQHFSSRNRFSDMTDLVTRYPQILGIGIDGGTAIVVQGNTAEVVGKGSVHFYDARSPRVSGGNDYDSVKVGGTYNLELRRPG